MLRTSDWAEGSASNRSTVKSTQECLRVDSVYVLEWPRQRPDSNPIKHLWRDLKMAVLVQPDRAEADLMQSMMQNPQISVCHLRTTWIPFMKHTKPYSPVYLHKGLSVYRFFFRWYQRNLGRASLKSFYNSIYWTSCRVESQTLMNVVSADSDLAEKSTWCEGCFLCV